MKWKFSCETRNDIKLPPDYHFPQALNYLNSESNSFYILENDNGYIQCAGDKSNCTVELREYKGEGDFKHFVFYKKNGLTEEFSFKMSSGTIKREIRHSFRFLEVAKLFLCYFNNEILPDYVDLEDITQEFKSVESKI